MHAHGFEGPDPSSPKREGASTHEPGNDSAGPEPRRRGGGGGGAGGGASAEELGFPSGGLAAAFAPRRAPLRAPAAAATARDAPLRGEVQGEGAGRGGRLDVGAWPRLTASRSRPHIEERDVGVGGGGLHQGIGDLADPFGGGNIHAWGGDNVMVFAVRSGGTVGGGGSSSQHNMDFSVRSFPLNPRP